MLGWLTSTSLGRTVTAIAVATVAVCAAIGAAFYFGGRNQRQRQEIAFRRAGWQADRRIDNADIGRNASDDDTREWLRQRGRRSRRNP